ncbi:RibD family protein [Candidatus Nitrosacidococcus tergens]|uniref:Bifunctional deaminase-reductase domain protein n=1 Tax=Candidatus Nitrosacidococcus tergens TaxID=553981 RepID=A0A7G1Q8S2_9GAMM|nr:dihydrofolate reductase family protein [Candidatus Nitrosacidococcus tergens]CAB1275378.1 Bifunctional deaminase-reductase domain protein [Candidatus Nitrosacidococcus tergens]
MNSNKNCHNQLIKIFPNFSESISLKNLFLNQNLRKLGTHLRPFVYANFITSLDGRISLVHSKIKDHVVPETIANKRDWRLFQELATQADGILVSGRYMRQLAKNTAQDGFPVSTKSSYQDLIKWRISQGLSPQPAIIIISSSLDFTLSEKLLNSDRSIYVAIGSNGNLEKIRRFEEKGIRIIIAGSNIQVEGRQLITALGQARMSTIYMAAGSQVFHTLIKDHQIDRLYLTHALKLLGGTHFDTLLSGDQLALPAEFKLHALYYDKKSSENEINQLFAIYDRCS